MGSIRNVWRKVIWEDAKEDRGAYYVIYSPINLKNCNLASLYLVYTSPAKDEKIAFEMEKELEIWASKYPLPLKVTALDEKGDQISLDHLKPSDELIGYFDNNKLIKSWRKLSEETFGRVTDEQLKQIYKGLPFQTRKEKEEEAENKLKEKRNIKKFLDFTLLTWLFVLILISYLGWQNYWVGALAFFYALYKIIRRGFRLFGHKTKKELENQEIERKKNHYYYHCERNPEGFAKLRAENFDLREKERIQEEKSKIK